MARIRSIHPEACDSEKLAELTDAAERMYWRLQTHCDDDGICEDNPKVIRARCATLLDWTVSDVDHLLDELVQVGLVQRYEAVGRRWVYVEQFARFQKVQRPTRGVRPFPDGTFAKPMRRGKDATPADVGRVTQGGETRRGQVADVSNSAGGPVAAGEEGNGEERTPPEGGGGGLGEEGGNRGNRDRPFTETPAVNPAVSRLHARLAASPGGFDGNP